MRSAVFAHISIPYSTMGRQRQNKSASKWEVAVYDREIVDVTLNDL